MNAPHSWTYLTLQFSSQVESQGATVLRKGSPSCLQEMPQWGNSLHLQPSTISQHHLHTWTHKLELPAVLLSTASLQKSKLYSRDRSFFHPVPLCMPTSLCWCLLDAAYQKLVHSAATTQDHPVCVGAKVSTMGLQVLVMHMEHMEALFPQLLYCILVQVTTIKVVIIMMIIQNKYIFAMNNFCKAVVV